MLTWVMGNNVFILKKKANGFIVSGVAVLLAQFFGRLVIYSTTARDGSDVCSSNASYYDRYDPDHDGWNSCIAHANIELVGNALMFYIVSVLNAEMWFKIRYGMKDIQLKTHKLVIRSSFAAVITGWTFAYMFGADVNINQANHHCGWRATDIMEHFWSYDFPVILIVGTIIAVDLVLAFTMIKMATATGGNSFGKIWKSYKYIFGLMLSFVISWMVVILVYDVDVYLVQYDSYVRGMTEYMDCVFAHFVSEDNTEYLEICGDRPAVRYPLYGHYVLMCVYLFVSTSHFIINYWSAAISKFYLDIIDKVFSVSIASRLLPKSTHESRYESKMESHVELPNKKKPVAVIVAAQVKTSKVTPIEDGQGTHRSDDSVPLDGNKDTTASGSPACPQQESKKMEVAMIQEVDESGRTLTNGGNIADDNV